MPSVRDFAIDPVTGDLAVVNGDFAVVADLPAVMQGIKIRVQLFLGEYWLDESVGVDWVGQILVKNPNPLVVAELLRQAVADTPDVTEVVAAALVWNEDNDRTGTISFTVRTVYSEEPQAGEVTVQ